MAVSLCSLCALILVGAFLKDDVLGAISPPLLLLAVGALKRLVFDASCRFPPERSRCQVKYLSLRSDQGYFGQPPDCPGRMDWHDSGRTVVVVS
jgi:hypothetical protein